MNSIELYAGAGGLAMGVSMAGFESLAVVEWDQWACQSIRENQRRSFPLVSGWPLFEGDVRNFDWSSTPKDIDLLAGGPPCQPFSLAGKHKAFCDKRDMFPKTVDIIRQLQPKSFILENVKGLTRSSFANYYQYILLQLEFPEVTKRTNESWMGHFERLQKEKTAGHNSNGLAYQVVPTLVNAADFGVPQKRERVFIVGFRADLGVKWSFPKPTHSLDSLLHSQWITGEYWDHHAIARKNRPELPKRFASRTRKLSDWKLFELERPWRTVRDALIGMPNPTQTKQCLFTNHIFQPGARVYPGHTGSPLDLPAKTLKAGDHGVPGGENMMVCDDGTVRYFTARESARLQTFPDGYVLKGAWSEIMRQLGNAVPVVLGKRVAASVAEELLKYQVANTARVPQRNRA